MIRLSAAMVEVDLDAITFGDETAEIDNTGVILDTGTSLIALPSTLAELLYVYSPYISPAADTDMKQEQGDRCQEVVQRPVHR